MRNFLQRTGTVLFLLLTFMVTKAQDITAKWDFQNGVPASITSVNIQGTNASGTVESDVEGIVMAVLAESETTAIKLQYNSSGYAQFNTGTVLQVPVKNAGDEVTVVSYPGQFKFTVGGTAATDNTTVYSASAADARKGYVEVIATATAYLYSITVVQKPAEEAEVLTDKAVTATFPFDTGEEGQTASFGDEADYFLSSKVVTGEGVGIVGKKTDIGMSQTLIQPKAKDSAAGAGNAIQFMIQPKFGYTFTPKSVSFQATRYGTDGGKLDVAWVNPDGTTVSLATGVQPNRNNNETQKYTDFSYEISDATVAEGACGLQINLYNLDNTKQYGFDKIVITGLLNGQEKEVAMLGSFTANGVSYNADETFEADGESYKATIELSKKETMISSENPISEATALSGEVGEISYSGDETECTATIPVSMAGITINYIVSFVQKPDFTLTYINTDGSEMGTQSVEKDASIKEFAVDFTTAICPEGEKVRGWFVKNYPSRKFTTSDIITEDTKLYAVATEIEVESTSKKYEFNLGSDTFYAEDHEAFIPTGSGKWHDAQHGWVFSNGDKIDLLVGGNATIFVGLCKYSKAGTTFVFKKDGEEVGSIEAVPENDGETATFNYEGAAGTLTMEISSTGAVYLHNLKIVNTTATNYQKDGNWFVVKAGDASSLLDVLDAVNGINASKSAERTFVFIPNGTYDLKQTALTPVSGHNISIIGQSAEGVIIKNAPDKENEGIGTTAVLLNSGQNLYMQDLTLKNELDYYGTTSAGRGVCFQDKGDRNIFKNVSMLSYQDTYYSQNTKQAYWEDCDIHGTVDFICGAGDVRFKNTTLSLEARNQNGTGERTITAPTTSTAFGYVFDGCKVVDLAAGKGSWNFGRTWQNEPICVYLNTILDANAKATLVKSRWTQKGMNNKDPKVFGEYGTKDEAGNDITPSSNIITSHGGTFETILTAEAAAAYSYEKMFSENANAWDPASLTIQKAAPEASYADGILSWTAVEGAIAYAIFKNGEFVAIVENESSYEIEATEGDELSIRSANSMGGFGEAAIVKMESAETTPKPELIHTASASWSSNTGKNSVDSETEYYNNDASTGWAGVAFAEFKMNVPAGATITGAELTWTTITGGRANTNRDNKVYYLNAGTTVDYDDILAAENNWQLTDSKTFIENYQGMNTFSGQLDVTDAVKAIFTAGQENIIFQWTGNNASAQLAGKASENAPVLTINFIPGAPELQNRTFDEDQDNVLTVITQGYERNTKEGEVFGMQPVTGWTANEVQTASDPGFTGGVFAYGSTNLLNNKVSAPATNPEGEATGDALGLAAVWAGIAQYTQHVKLPAGDYKLTYLIYNAANTGELEENLFGFIADDGTKYLSDQKTFAEGKWVPVTVTFTVDEETEGNISVGFKGKGGSGASPHLFIDNVQLEKVAGVDAVLPDLEKAIAAAKAEQAKYLAGEGLFQYPESELSPLAEAIAAAEAARDAEDKTVDSIKQATETLNAAVEAFSPQFNKPEPTQAYNLALTTSEGTYNLKMEGGSITIAEEGTPVYLIEQADGSFAISDGTEYVVYEGGNAWTMTTGTDPYGWTIAATENGYTITGKNGFLGTNTSDGNAAGSPCYGDKKTTNGNYIWNITETEPDAINTVEAHAASLQEALRSGRVHDLSGRISRTAEKGHIYIINGRKQLVR